MEQESKTPVSPSAYIRLKAAEAELGITRVTLRRYLKRLGIEPRAFHIRDRSLYISQEEFELVKRLKLNPALLDHLRLHPP